MANASYVQSSFLGGLVSKWTQGRYHDQHYRTWMASCLNGFPIETEAWVRRPGFALAGPTRGGAQARVIKFDYSAAAPLTMEFTANHLRFWQGTALYPDGSAGLSSVSTANPAVLTLATAQSWSTGDEVYISGLGTTLPLLQNRRFKITKISTTLFSIADAITGASVNGAGFGAPAAGAVVYHVLDFATPYDLGQLPDLHCVQTDNAVIILHRSDPPAELIAVPTSAQFLLFEDGPYLDPFTNGAQVVPNQLTGIVTLTLQFPAYVATTSYSKGAFVTSASVNYESLIDQNVGNTPASSPSDWQPVAAATALNGGQGLLQTDIGRLVRLFSEPAAWAAGSTYSAGNVVSFNPTGMPGAATYWQSLTGSNTGIIPGTNLTNWEIVAPGAALPAVGELDNPTAASGPALWTWGKIVSISNAAPFNPSGIAYIGNMTGNGGLSAAFNGTLSQAAGVSAESTSANAYVGENFAGCTPSSHAINSVTIYPTSDEGLVYATAVNDGQQPTVRLTTNVTVSLYGANSSPASFNNGTLLGAVALPPADIIVHGFGGAVSLPIGLSAVNIQSSDTSTAYSYLWVVISVSQNQNGFTFTNTNWTTQIAQVQFAVPPGTGIASGYNVELLGPQLIYTQPITTWRMGIYSNTTGWPSTGTYAEGRLWLSSPTYPNRVDACVANGINGVNNGNMPGSVNFAPTDQYGNVSEANSIDYTFNAPDANPILWMIPDLQGVLCGTSAGEWIVQAPTSGGIGPTNIVARRMTTIGSANIEPRRCEHTIVFVQRFLRKIVEFFPDVFSGKFTAPNLSKDAKQLTVGNLQEIAFQQELAPIIWARVNNGLIGTTYRRDTLMTSSGPTMNGWHQHSLGSGRSIESLVVGSSVNGTLDALTIVTNDPATNVRWVEVLSPILDEGSTLNQAQYLDGAIPASSTAAVAPGVGFPNGGLQINGLWWLNGYTVSAWLGGLDCGDYVVSNGSISVPYGDGAGGFPAAPNRNDQGLFTAAFVSTGITANGTVMFSPGFGGALVGFSYPSVGEIVRPNMPAESGSRSGPGFGKLRRSHWIMMQVEGAGIPNVVWGSTSGTPLPVPFRQPNGAPYTVDQQFTGIVRDNLSDDYSFDSIIGWEQTRPFPLNVQAIGSAIETQDI